MKKAETYFTVETEDGRGLNYITECGNEMYHIGNNPMTYHGCLCPKCFWKNKKVTLYLEGTDEANKYCHAKQDPDKVGKDAE